MIKENKKKLRNLLDTPNQPTKFITKNRLK